MSNLILSVNDLTKKYGDKIVLDNISFKIEKGKIYGFIGENGAGKTTTIRAITGLTSEYEGTIELFGKSDKKGLEQSRKKMGCLVEKPILSLNDTAFNNLKMQQILYGQNDDKKIIKLLERVGLSKVENKKVKDFSLGMKQRLGIAMSLINNPELLILDEPVNGLDPMGMVAIRKLLHSLCEDEGITIIISSHILAELYQLVSDFIIISHGRIIQTLSKKELDEKCSSYVIIETKDTNRAIETLKKHHIKNLELSDNTIKIYDNINKDDLAKWLFDEKILLTLIMKYEKTLEEYYMDLLGGNNV